MDGRPAGGALMACRACGCGCGEVIPLVDRRGRPRKRVLGHSRGPRHKRPASERFFEKVDRDWSTGCWRWTSVIKANGYDAFWAGGRFVQAHRYAYELSRGTIPAGLTIDHLCRLRACVNPAHLEAVSIGVNTRRSPYTLPSINAAKTTCPSGHNYQQKQRQRYCRVCENARRRVRAVS